MSVLGRLYSRISPHLAHRPGSAAPPRAQAWLIKKTRGRLGARFFGGAPLIVLRTTGRRSGEARESPMLFVRDGPSFVVCPSNAASRRPPAWWLNLQATPDAEVYADGRWHPVRAREASPEEAKALWPRMRATYEGFDHYVKVAGREFPLVVLEPR